MQLVSFYQFSFFYCLLTFSYLLKGGQSAKNTVTWVGQVKFYNRVYACLCLFNTHFLFQDWLLSAPSDKPLLNVWQCNRSEQSPVRLFSPSSVSAMAVSPRYRNIHYI